VGEGGGKRKIKRKRKEERYGNGLGDAEAGTPE
jgi:hypothetical protein